MLSSRPASRPTEQCKDISAPPAFAPNLPSVCEHMEYRCGRSCSIPPGGMHRRDGMAMDTLYYLFLIFCFLAVVLFLEGGYLVWYAHRGPEAKRIQERLRAVSAGRNAT